MNGHVGRRRVGGMRATLLMIVVVAMVGCGKRDEAPQSESQPEEATKKPESPKIIPNSPEAKAAIEAAIREEIKKPTGELTEADLEKVTKLKLWSKKLTDVSALTGLTKMKVLWLHDNQLTDLSALVGLANLEQLDLRYNPNLTKAEIVKFQKALPKCIITHTAGR